MKECKRQVNLISMCVHALLHKKYMYAIYDSKNCLWPSTMPQRQTNVEVNFTPAGNLTLAN